MFDLQTSSQDVQPAVTVATGDRVTAPDGSEWLVTRHNGRALGESFVRLEAVDDRSEERGVPEATFFDDYEIQETDEPQRQECIGWSCCCCDWQQREPDNEPDYCPQCYGGQVRRRYHTRGRQ